MAKGLIIGGILTAVTATALYKAFSLKGKVSAANDLKLDFGNLEVTQASVKKGIDFVVTLRASNNSATDLVFTQPFIQLSILDAKGAKKQIASSSSAEGVTKLQARKISNLTFNLSISPAQAVKIPGLLVHMVKKVCSLSPDPITILAEYGLTAEGFNIKDNARVPI